MKKMTNRKWRWVSMILAIMVMVAFTSTPQEAMASTPKKPDKVAGLKASDRTTTSITLAWKKDKGYRTNGKILKQKYQIYRATQKSNGKYTKFKKIATVKDVKGNRKVVDYKNKKLKNNTKYKYKVRVIRKYKGKWYKGKFSKVLVKKTIKRSSKTVEYEDNFWTPTSQMKKHNDNINNIINNDLSMYYDMMNSSTNLGKILNNQYEYKAGKPKYTYKIYDMFPSLPLLANSSNTLSNEAGKLYYVKTNNPDPDSFDMLVQQSGNKTIGYMTMDALNNQNYLDVDWVDKKKGKVEGGYIFKVTDNLNVGKATLTIREKTSTIPTITYYDLKTEELTTKKNIPLWTKIDSTKKDITVASMSQEEQRLNKAIISNATNSSMTKYEKAESIWNYIETRACYPRVEVNGEYIALWSSENTSKYEFASEVGRMVCQKNPLYDCYVSDSYTTPNWVASFGKSIGFPELRSMYGDYPIGSSLWRLYHSDVTDDNEFHMTCCPGGVIPYTEKKIDFSQYK